MLLAYLIDEVMLAYFTDEVSSDDRDRVVFADAVITKADWVGSVAETEVT